MRALDKLFKKNLIDIDIKKSIIFGRGNIKETFPSDFSEGEKENITFVREMTMTSPERLVSLSRAVEYISKNNIAGDIVECGVWRGGSMMLVAKKLIQLKETNRNLFLFDTFEGMSAPDSRDVSAIDNSSAQELLEETDKMQGDNVWCYSSLDEVKANLRTTRYPEEMVHYFKGKVEDTLPEKTVGTIALLRLDTDWYESTKHELEVLYDQLVVGGILIIDDYGHWSGSKKAVDEFIEERKLTIFLNRIDYTGRIAIKN